MSEDFRKSLNAVSYFFASASFITALSLPPQAFAAVRLPSIISDHMVVQANDKPRIWGWAEPSEKIEVEYLGKTVKARADAEGKWEVFLEKIEPGKIFDLNIKGANEILVKDVIAGQVWVCSGQSNMEFGLGRADNAQEELNCATPPIVRFFKTRRVESAQPNDDVDGSWTTFSKTGAAGWSAVGYFFAKKLASSLQEPVGMIESAVGGTQIKTWMSPDMVKTGILNEDSAKPPNLPIIVNPVNQPSPTNGSTASCFYNGMVNGYTPYTISGFIWYQGEANAGQAAHYGKLFPALISDWRTKWNAPILPFLFVQLPNFGTKPSLTGKSNWAELREAQSLTLKVKNTAMAVTIDIGDPKNIHPQKKEPVGTRLALAALNVAYQQQVPYKGPVMDTIKNVNNSLVLHFKNADNGLCIRPDEAGTAGNSVQGFFICDNQQNYFPADAKIEGDTIVLSSSHVAEPTAVRYGWSDNPNANLQNGFKLQASPFRASVANGNESIPLD